MSTSPSNQDRKGPYIVSQMQSITDRRQGLNLQLHEPGLDVHAIGHQELVQRRRHGEDVVAGAHGHVVDGGVADDAVFGGCEGERHVTLRRVLAALKAGERGDVPSRR
jgi:hypothetical protein